MKMGLHPLIEGEVCITVAVQQFRLIYPYIIPVIGQLSTTGWKHKHPTYIVLSSSCQK